MDASIGRIAIIPVNACKVRFCTEAVAASDWFSPCSLREFGADFLNIAQEDINLEEPACAPWSYSFFFISGWVTSASAEDTKGTLETFLKAWGVDEGKVELIGATSAGGTTVYGLLVKARSKTESKIDLARKFTPIGMNELQYRQLISGNEVIFLAKTSTNLRKLLTALKIFTDLFG